MGQKKSDARETSNSVLTRRPVVLLVDEDRQGQYYYGVLLEELGYRVRGCGSYEEAVAVLGSEPFDFVVLNQGSPGFEGRAVLERAVEIDRRLPVLVLARCLDMRCYLEAMQLGAVDYLVEPLTGWEVGRVLESHLPVQSMAA